MHRDIEEGAIQSDAYIDALLGGHARLPVPLPSRGLLPQPNVRHVIRLIESGLPRFHPSFLFEERLAGQLRAAATTEAAATPAEIQTVVLDRRVLMGGAIASGFSIAGAAMFAWRRRPSRGSRARTTVGAD
jgi:hypothetical protein